MGGPISSLKRHKSACPTLSERRVDIPLLARHFLEQTAKELNDEPKRLHRSRKIHDPTSVAWECPTIRKHMSLVACNGQHTQILKSDFPPELFNDPVDLNDHDWEKSLKFWALAYLENQSSEPLLDIATPIFERIMIESALQKTNGGSKKQRSFLVGAEIR